MTMLCAVCGMTTHETGSCPTVKRWMEGDDGLELRAKPDGELEKYDEPEFMGGFDFAGAVEELDAINAEVKALIDSLGGVERGEGMEIPAEKFGEFMRGMQAITDKYLERRKLKNPDEGNDGLSLH